MTQRAWHARKFKGLIKRLQTAADVLALVAATPLAFLLQFDFNPAAVALQPLLQVTLLLAAAKLLAYFLLRFWNRPWSHTGFRDQAVLTQLLLFSTAGAMAALLLLRGRLDISLSIVVLDALLAFLLLAGLRAASRWQHERRAGSSRAGRQSSKRVLVIGAGEAGLLLARELQRHPETRLLPVAFLDDDHAKQGERVAGIPVVGLIRDVGRVLASHAIDKVLISMPSQPGRTLRRVIEEIRRADPEISYKIIPGMYELLSGRVGIKRVRDVEIEDLLGRSPVRLDADSISSYLEGRRIMITGAGGSIGSELVRQICRFKPAGLILFGHGENSIHGLERELERDWPGIPFDSVIGAIQNGSRLEYIFTRFKPDVVFHAAAHKHVPLMELNPEEAVFNNIIGSRNLVELALRFGISHFVNISTDKAVNPTSVMGASKRVVELIVQDAARRATAEQTFVSVRFGNVLGSRGSVIPVFKSQIQAGGPVTVTHPDMVRFFMTIPEASQLVLQGAGQGSNGETYILKMGEPVRIVDLARDLIRLSGFEPDVDIPVVFTGIRPGEKLFEELMTSEEQRRVTSHEKIFVAHSEQLEPEELHRLVDRLQEAALGHEHVRSRQLLQEALPGCQFTAAPAAGGQHAGEDAAQCSLRCPGAPAVVP
jgi:FlaA1/EpsC-like NDP-sugar epimerase